MSIRKNQQCEAAIDQVIITNKTYAASDAVLRPETLLEKPNTFFKLSLAAPKSLCGKDLL